MQALEATIAKLEGRVTGFEADARAPARSFDAAGQAVQPWRLGTEALDRYLPHGLALRGVHDITPEMPVFTPAAGLFAQCLVQRFIMSAKRPGPVAYVQVETVAREYGRPYGPGLCQPIMADGLSDGPGNSLGSLASRLLCIRVRHQRDLAQTLEDAVRTAGLAAVIGEGAALPFKMTKRLDRASQTSGVPLVMVHACGTRDASAASTRWMLRPARGPGDHDDPKAPGAPGFHLRLSRIRHGSGSVPAEQPLHSPGSVPAEQPLMSPGSFSCPGDDRIFHVHWDPTTLAFDLVSPLRHGQVSGDGTQGAQISSSRSAGTEREIKQQWRNTG
ncbi:MAG: hypothetical protein AAF739_15775 [Pseudomonadota bacterium]